MKKFFILIVVILICISAIHIDVFAAGNTPEDLYEEGMEFFKKEDYSRAFARFQISGDTKGYAPAQNMLGICYRDGLGTEQDLSEAEKYFRLSSEQGYSPARENLDALVNNQTGEETDKSEAYQEAMNLYFAGQYEEAKSAFEALGDYERSADFAAMCDQAINNDRSLKQPETGDQNTGSGIEAPVITWADSVKVGDNVVYGSYEQDNNTVNGSEPIEWIVLEVQNDRALLISKNALESKQYNDVHAYVYWQASTLRRWLNADFYNDAFSDSEKLAVLSTEVKTEALSKNNSIAGGNTQDRVFLLSTAEAEQYFSSNDARTCSMSSYAQLHAATDQIKWWLRTSGTMNDDACYVDAVGGIHSSGDKVHRTGMCVRPAIWLSLKPSELPPAEDGADSEAADDIQSSIWLSSAGETVVFGSYEQDNNLENGKEPIEWMILNVEDDHAVLISKKALDAQSVNPTDNVTWEECMLRAWLNSAFFEEAFSEEEQKQILWAKAPADRNPKNPVSIGNDTTERVSLLSMKEANELFLADDQRMCEPTAYARTKGAHVSDNGMTYWWLRTVSLSNDAYVSNEGTIEYRGELRRSDFTIRPVIWIRLDNTKEMPPVETGISEMTKRMLTSVSVGDIIQLGSIDQDNNFSNGKEQIEWQVLDIQSNKALVISKDALFVIPYHSDLVETTWEASTLRYWLNSTFLTNAFSKVQQQMILEEIIKADKNPYAATDPGHNTFDKIFLLSVSEVEKLLPDTVSRECSPSENAKMQKAYLSSNGKTWWWLRTPGLNKVYAAAVHGDGAISSDQAVNKNVISVRPAMWISLID